MFAHYYCLHFAYHLKGEAKHIGGRPLNNASTGAHSPTPIRPGDADEGMPISLGIMRPQRVLGRERA
jgi:hypothetical protein